MRNSRHNPETEGWSKQRPHDKFCEMCAISTSGELTEEERTVLRAHLASCAECRQALREFEAAADIGVPLLHSHLDNSDFWESSSVPAEAAEAVRTRTVQARTARTEEELVESKSGLAFSPRNAHCRMQVNWNYVWMPFAAAIVLTAALGIYSFQFGKHSGQEVAQITPGGRDQSLDKLESRLSDISHDRQILTTELAQRDGMIAGLRQQLKEESVLVVELKKTQAGLENSHENDQSEQEQAAQERTALTQKIGSLQASLLKTEKELDALKLRRSEDQSFAESLTAQISDLHGQLRDREQELGRQQDLLAHDRDIRELMGARDLYIAEVYDVARDGQTQKPYGRVFYTKGKSLVFYAYDLDQQAGLKSASTFQAWGSRGLDKLQATSLGVFYEDNVAKKRWVVKFDDPKKLEQIDSVFVTIEPYGGSHKPSGKSLLFAYLKIEPNHP